MKLKKIWEKLSKSERGLIFREKERPNIFIPEHLALDMMRNYVEGRGGKIKLIDWMLPSYEIKRGVNWWYILPKSTP